MRTLHLVRLVSLSLALVAVANAQAPAPAVVATATATLRADTIARTPSTASPAERAMGISPGPRS